MSLWATESNRGVQGRGSRETIRGIGAPADMRMMLPTRCMLCCIYPRAGSRADRPPGSGRPST